MRVVLRYKEDADEEDFSMAVTLDDAWMVRPVARLVSVFEKRLRRRYLGEKKSLVIVDDFGFELSGTIGSVCSDSSSYRIRPWLLSRYDRASAALFEQDRVSSLLAASRWRDALDVVEKMLRGCFDGKETGGRDLGMSLMFSRAVCLAEMGRDTEAECAYRAALDLFERLGVDTRSIRHNLVLVLLKQGDEEGAALEARRCAEVYGDAGSWYDFAAVARDGRETIFGYEKALEADPTHAPSYFNLVSALEKELLLDRAASVARTAILRGVAWSTPLQRPQFWFPGLTAKAWWDANDFWFAQLLRDHRDVIRSEWLGADAGREVGDRRGFRHDGTLKVKGSWKEHVFFQTSETPFPKTQALLGRIREAVEAAGVGCGETLFSTLSPGTVLRHHCGSTNARLTLHFGVVIPEGAEITCGAETRTWVEGDSIVFDDSFQHAVEHKGGSDRTVLLINFWHPEVPTEMRTDVSWRSKARHGSLLESYSHTKR